ncbi:DivIVA domain-containing protein [Synechococcus moorigangaii CMS01]|nr:DivIVA domain-containing protein [Synechococcus moorigangaii CMS01]
MVQSSSSPDKPADNNANSPTLYRGVDLNVQEQLTHLEEVIFDGFQLPLVGMTLVKDDDVLDQLDQVRASVPDIIERAVEVLQYKQQLLEEAQAYAEEMMAAAERRAAQMLDEMLLTRQAEQKAAQLRYETEQECQALRQTTLAELEDSRQRITQELQQLRSQAIAEAQVVQQDADQYAHNLLSSLEVNLREQLDIVQNGRRQLQPPPPLPNPQTIQGSGLPQNRRPPQQRRQPKSR